MTNVKGHGAVQEVIAKALFSIENVPVLEQRKMVNRAAWRAAEMVEDVRRQCLDIVKGMNLSVVSDDERHRLERTRQETVEKVNAITITPREGNWT